MPQTRVRHPRYNRRDRGAEKTRGAGLRASETRYHRHAELRPQAQRPAPQPGTSMPRANRTHDGWFREIATARATVGRRRLRRAGPRRAPVAGHCRQCEPPRRDPPASPRHPRAGAPRLLPLLPQPYLAVRTLSVRASRRCRVCVETNRYSVPPKYAGALLTLQLSSDSTPTRSWSPNTGATSAAGSSSSTPITNASWPNARAANANGSNRASSPSAPRQPPTTTACRSAV